MSDEAPDRPDAGATAADVRRRQRSWAKASDRAAGAVITVGGLGVLAAMLGICVFLVSSALPLFSGGESGDVVRVESSSSEESRGVPIELWVAPTRSAVAVLDDDGMLRLVWLGERGGPEGPAADPGLGLADGPGMGAVLGERRLIPEGRTIGARSREAGSSGRISLGYDDGTVQIVLVSVERTELRPDEVPERLRTGTGGGRLNAEERAALTASLRLGDELGPDATVVYEASAGAVLWYTSVSRGEPIVLSGGSGSVRALDVRGIDARRKFIVAQRESGDAFFGVVSTRVPLGGGAPRVRVRTVAFDLSDRAPRALADHLFVSGDGRNAFAVWADGVAHRYDASDFRAGPRWVEAFDPTGGSGEVTGALMSLGSTSLVIGDAEGGVTAHFAVEDPVAGEADGRRMVSQPRLALGRGSVVAMRPSDRTRALAVGSDDGGVRVVDVTSRKLIASMPTSDRLDVPSAVGMPIGNDAVVAVDRAGVLRVMPVDPGYPEVSATTLFGRMHYEGYTRPEFVYQSTGTEASEPKYSLVPLIFGTIKATVFAMLFAAPLAVLAAIYSSEFLSPGAKRIIKPTVELMASLPSVVLGFVAAVVAAPLIRDVLPGALLSFVVVPVGVVLASLLWQLLPVGITRRNRPLARLAIATVVVAASLGVSIFVGGVVERQMFRATTAERLVAAGFSEPVETPEGVGDLERLGLQEQRRLRADGLFVVGERDDRRLVRAGTAPSEGMPRAEPGNLRLWLDGAIGSAWPGWALLMIPVGVIVVWVGRSVLLGRWWMRAVDQRTHAAAAGLELIRFVVSLVAAIVVAFVLAWLLTSLGLDARDSLFGTFSQRNTLVVGLIMGFAVVPLIYTISEDAMSSVPSNLRAASLGAGATRWQTAIRVVLPVAGSGIFSACMIGLGRAVGETMIVLMATGNTPEMSWNLFSGFRTLAANIAYELPEAPKDSTHYRVLFLCGLVLFAMTLLINTTAELVRQRFRKRNAAL